MTKLLLTVTEKIQKFKMRAWSSGHAWVPAVKLHQKLPLYPRGLRFPSTNTHKMTFFVELDILNAGRISQSLSFMNVV